MALITLTTDFGSDSPYVAQMKGVIYGLHPEATIVDVTHRIGPQNIREAAWILGDVASSFDADTIHVVVVDPGVGSDRPIVAARFSLGTFIAPDNGLLTRVATGQPPQRIVRLTAAQWWRPHVSSTFHGRDVMAPVAAHLARGVPLERLGADQGALQLLPWPGVERTPHGLVGHVMYIDSFGNLITNISRADLGDCPKPAQLLTTLPQADRPPRELVGLATHYAAAEPGQTITLIGSGNQLEIATVNGHAARALGVGVGDPIRLSWPA